jgi:uncharacterized protein YfeS
VSLTCEEARILAQGLEALRREYDEIAQWVNSDDDSYTLEKLRENFNQFLQ